MPSSPTGRPPIARELARLDDLVAATEAALTEAQAWDGADRLGRAERLARAPTRRGQRRRRAPPNRRRVARGGDGG